MILAKRKQQKERFAGRLSNKEAAAQYNVLNNKYTFSLYEK